MLKEQFGKEMTVLIHELEYYVFIWNIFNIDIPLSLYRADMSCYAPPVCFTDIEVNEFIRTEAEKYKVIIGITKENPAAYIREQLRCILEYAEEVGIGREEIMEMLCKDI